MFIQPTFYDSMGVDTIQAKTHLRTLLNQNYGIKSILHDVLLLDKEIPPSDLNNFVRNSAEPRF